LGEANPQMGRLIAVVNQKGGVGKTTTAVNASAALAELGHRVLIVDADPQGNATTGVGASLDQGVFGLYQLLSEQHSFDEVTHSTAVHGLSLIPSSRDLAGAEIELAGSTSRTEIRDVLKPSAQKFDYVIIDTPPSLGVLTLTCLVAAEQLLIPIQCEYYALEGLRQLLYTVDLVKRGLNPNLTFLGLLRTMFDRRTNLSQQVATELEQFFPGEVFATIIPRTVRLSEAPSYGESIITYDPRSAGAEAYRSLALEIVHRTHAPPQLPAGNSGPKAPASSIQTSPAGHLENSLRDSRVDWVDLRHDTSTEAPVVPPHVPNMKGDDNAATRTG